MWTSESLVTTKLVVQYAALATGLRGVRFVADNETHTVLFCFADETLLTPEVGPG